MFLSTKITEFTDLRLILKIFTVIIFSFVFGTKLFAATTDEVKQNIINQAKTMGVEPAIVLSIAKTESGFNQAARGSGGHIGVFQLSRATAKHMGINPYNLDDNIKGGILYYKKMYNIFGSRELAVAAYNVGPEAVKRCNNTVPKHSRPFVSKIMSDYKYYNQLYNK